MARRLTSRVLEDLLSSRENNLNLVRMTAAIAVLVSHAIPISVGEVATEPLEDLAGVSLGTLAVCIFFGISGLLIARSFDRRTTIVRFVLARILRLFPGLLAALVLTVAIGAAITTLPVTEYITTSETWTYIPRNLTLANLQFYLPGVFESNPLPSVVNGSLWTLFYEVICYAGVLFSGIVGLLRWRIAFSALFGFFTLAYVAGVSWEPAGGLAYKLDQLIGLAWPFALGMMAYIWRSRLVLDIRIMIVLWLICVPAAYAGLLSPALLMALLYSVAWFAFIPKGYLLKYNRFGDYSYGVYIYAYPTQQICAELFSTVDPVLNIIYSLPITLTMGFISWHLIEKRALGGVDALSRKISSKINQLQSRTANTAS